MLRFDKVATERLEVIAQELHGIYAENLEDMKAAQLARTLSVLARCELARREREQAR